MIMILIPVVEFAPTDYQTENHEIPDFSNYDSPESWDSYWRKSLAESGIVGLSPYEKGSCLVKIESLFDYKQAIEMMLIKHYPLDIDLESAEDIEKELSPLAGGYILELTEQLIIYPQCCGSLEDIHEWKKASEYLDNEEETIWIGHPWLLVSAIDSEHLQLRETTEYGNPEELSILKLKRSDLKSAIKGAEEKLFKFEQVLLPIVNQIMGNNAEKAVKILISGQY